MLHTDLIEPLQERLRSLGVGGVTINQGWAGGPKSVTIKTNPSRTVTLKFGTPVKLSDQLMDEATIHRILDIHERSADLMAHGVPEEWSRIFGDKVGPPKHAKPYPRLATRLEILATFDRKSRSAQG